MHDDTNYTATADRAVQHSPWLLVNEAAERARCKRRHIYDAIAQRQLKASRLGGRRSIRVHIDDLDAYLRSVTR